MATGYSFVGNIFGHDNELLIAGGIVAVATAALAWRCNVALKKAEDPIIPDDKFSFRTIGEGLAQFVLSLGDIVMGKHNRKYLPFVGCVFMYILFLNLAGLIPGFHGPTGGKWPESFLFNCGVAVVVFVCYHIWGIRDVGIGNYIKHLFGGSELSKFPFVFVGLFVCCVEIVSHTVRIFSLSLRLFGNITGDHLVLAVFTDLAHYVVPVVFYVLGAFVSFMQAFVFAMLSMVYIRFATEHEHSEEEAHH